MQIITQIKIDTTDTQQILLGMARFNSVCNYLSRVAFEEKLFYWFKLQRRAYYEIKEGFGITAAEAVTAIRKVAYAYKDKKKRTSFAEFRSLGAIPLYRHLYRDGKVRFYGIEVPIVIREDVELPKHPKQGTLSYRNGKLIIHQVIEVHEPGQYKPNGWLGCDLGIKNILTDSDGRIYSGGHLNNLRKRNNKIRARLQSKGTRSARRLLNKRRYKESRFMRDANHTISKIVSRQRRNAGYQGGISSWLTASPWESRIRPSPRSRPSRWMASRWRHSG
jgi:predicted transposase